MIKILIVIGIIAIGYKKGLRLIKTQQDKK